MPGESLKLVGRIEIKSEEGVRIHPNKILDSGKLALYAILSGADERNMVYLLRLGTSTTPPSPDQTGLIEPLPYDFLVGSRDYDTSGVSFTFPLPGLPNGLRFSEAALFASYYDTLLGQVQTVAVSRAVFTPITVNASYSYQLTWKLSLV